MQLNSVPVQILASEWCFGECPSLRGEQRMAMLASLREASGGLAPEIRDMALPEIFERSSCINAAFTLWWATLSGETQGVLPYRVMGYTAKGEKLLAALNELKVREEPRCAGIVDAWATILDMRDWYSWTPHNR